MRVLTRRVVGGRGRARRILGIVVESRGGRRACRFTGGEKILKDFTNFRTSLVFLNILVGDMHPFCDEITVMKDNISFLMYVETPASLQQ